MKRRKFEIPNLGDGAVLVPIVELMGLLKLDKSVKEIMREIREEKKALEERRLNILGLI